MITQKQIESIGWKLEKSYDFGDSYIWEPDLEFYNRPTLFVGKKEGYHKFEITKFNGQNDWFGKMGVVFLGNCENFEQLKMICKLVELNNYKKFRL